jgi:hypothetical protein
MMIIFPPVPAPYLDAVPQLPAELLRSMDGRRKLSKAQRDRAARLIRKLKREIFLARSVWEAGHGVRIKSEPVVASSPGAGSGA